MSEMSVPESSTPLVILTKNVSRETNISYNENENVEASGSVPKRARTYSKWSPSEEGVTLAWSDLSVYGKTKSNGGINHKRIINSVTGAIKPGSFVAIMGASGAGKSTLMAALAYRNSELMVVEGDILINGRPIGNYMRCLSGFMHQEDIFIASLTVREHMNIMANLKLDRRVSSTEKDSKIKDILKQLGLLKCFDVKIGTTGQNKALSGGEQKRLAFATELLTDPPILFCDEPTTGLDSYSAQKLVKIMSRMSTTGKTILCTIHQPSSDIFTSFDQLILVAEGRLAYMGNTSRATHFFESLGFICPSSYSPADFFIKTLASSPGFEHNNKQVIKKICDHFAVSDYAKEVDVIVQYEFHMGRAVTSIATIIGLCYYKLNPLTQSGVQAVQGAIFMFVSENTFLPMYSVMAEFPEGNPLFLREYRSGLYHPATYYLSRILALLPIFIVEPIVFTLIAYWLSGLRPTIYAFFMTTLITTLTMNVASACGIMFSNAFSSVSLAMAYLVPFDTAIMVISGLFIKLDTLPSLISWTKYASWFMYSSECLSIIQWDAVSNITCNTIDPDLPCITNGDEVLAQYSFKKENFAGDIWSMVILCLLFYIVGFICLLRRTRRK